MLNDVKYEPSDMDIGTTVLQHMDTYYTINKPNTSAVTEEHTIVDDCNRVMPRSEVKTENVEVELGVSRKQLDMNDSGVCRVLHSLKLKTHKDRLASICRVQLVKLDTFTCNLCDAIYAENDSLHHHLQSVHGIHPQISLPVKFHETDKQQCTAGGNVQQYVQGTSTPIGTGSVNEGCSTSLDDLLNDVKHEPSDMDIGTTVLQHMDTYYTINKPNTSAVTEKHIIADDCHRAIPSSEVKKESVEDELGVSHKLDMNDLGVCRVLHSFELKTNKDRLASICRVQLMKLDTFRCKWCDAVYAENHALLHHLRSVHGIHPQTSSPVKFHETDKQQCTADTAALAQYPSIASLQSQVYRCIQMSTDECEQNFETHQHLLRHTMQVHGNEACEHLMYKCDKCLEVYTSKTNIYQHITQVHGTKSLKCTQCHQTFLCKIAYLRNGARYIHYEIQYTCDCVLCKKMHKTQAALDGHVSRVHSSRSADPVDSNCHCDECTKTFQSKRVFTSHCEYKHGTECYKCKECKKEFESMPYLQIHKNIVHSKKEENPRNSFLRTFEDFIVAGCRVDKNAGKKENTISLHAGEGLTSKKGNTISLDAGESLASKKENIISSDAGDGLCRTKDEQIEHSQVRDETIEDNQKDNETISCKYCGQTMTKDYYNEVHMMSCLGQQKNLQQQLFHKRRTMSSNGFNCNTCNKTFHKVHLLRAHNKLHQTNCRKTSVSTSSTVAGPSNQSQDETRIEKSYQCDTCDARFAYSKALIIHMRVHTGEKPYQCDTCNARFAYSGGITVHMRVHTGEKPYQCDTCDARFTQRGTLTCHMRIHTGEKPYQCDKCDARFTQRNGLNSHLRVHTRETPYRCNTQGLHNTVI